MKLLEMNAAMVMMSRSLACAAAAALLLAGASPLLAQRKTAEDVAKEGELAARAEKEAKALREEAAASTVKPLVAMVPVTPDNVWVLDLSDGGHVRILLRPDVAPGTVDRIKALTRQHFYDGLQFHRVIDGFMAQGGDPKGDGTGGSELPDLKAEFNWLPHMRGTVSMARAQGEDSANSQFYIMLMPRMQLDHKYTVFGRVISGMDGVDQIAKGEPPEAPTKITRAYIEADGQSAAAQ
jgi:peptidylprolyl isomerase